MHRAQILLEPEQHQILVRLAQREGRSISEIIREMIKNQLRQRKQAMKNEIEKHLEAIQRIHNHRESILARRGNKPIKLDIAKTLDEIREEHDKYIAGSIHGHRN